MRDAFAVSVVSGIFQSKAVWQFAQMIECVQPDVNALAYNEYGCWCGLGGKGTPVDGVDRYVHGWRTGERLQRGSLLRCVWSCRCCRTHDHCYEESRKAPGCTAVEDLPYIIEYKFSCSKQQVTCSGEASVCI